MPSCLLKYRWVKLPRNRIPSGKGVMGHWMKLASRVAFRNGQARYCGYINDVAAGSWAGGVVGLKSILGIKDRSKALSTLNCLFELGYINYDLNTQTKKLTYSINDWVVECTGDPCSEGAVYATEGYGFLCVPRKITQPLVAQGYTFGELDAWLDLWCHTTWKDKNNAFTFLAPAIQFSRQNPILTLDGLGARWGWEKTKVWRFFKKYAADFCLLKLPGSYGCLVFNTSYPGANKLQQVLPAEIKRILNEIRIKGANTHKYELTDHQYLNRLVMWYSSSAISSLGLNESEVESRVALSSSIYIRAYFSYSCNNIKLNIDCYSNRYTSHNQKIDSKNKEGSVGRAGPSP